MAIIATSNDMLTRMASGGAFKLDGDQLKTQSKAAHFFQKIGDTFKSMSAAGRESIALRNERLEAKMADILRAGEPAVPNLAQAPLQGAAANKAAVNTAFLKFTIARQVERAFPDPAKRQAAGNLVKLALINKPDVTGGSAKDICAAVDAKVKLLKANIDKFPIAFSYSYGDAEFASSGFKTEVRDSTNAEFERECQSADAHFEADNIHKSLPKDAHRSMIKIDGEFVRDDAVERMRAMTAGMHPQMVRFLSMIGPQSGLVGALSMSLLMEGTRKDHPEAKTMATLNASGMNVDFKEHCADYHREGDMMHVRLSSDAFLMTLGTNRDVVTQFTENKQTTGIAGRHYDIEMVIDLSQDMTGKTTPDYTLTGTCTALSDADVDAYNAKYHK